MRPAMWTSYFIDLSPEEMVRTLAKKGWFELELSSEHAQTLLDRGDAGSEGRRFRDFAADLGVSLPQGHLWLKCNICAVDQPPVIDALKRWLDLFVALGVRAGVLHGGTREKEGDERSGEEITAARIHALRTLSDHVRGEDLTICLENGPAGVAHLLEKIHAVDRPNLGICLDTGHLNLGDCDQAEFIRKAGKKYLKALHIADNEGQRDQHMMPFAFGMGGDEIRRIPWSEVIAALREIGYQELFNFEIPGESHGCPLEVRLAKLDYVKKLAAIMLEGKL